MEVDDESELYLDSFVGRRVPNDPFKKKEIIRVYYIELITVSLIIFIIFGFKSLTPNFISRSK